MESAQNPQKSARGKAVASQGKSPESKLNTGEISFVSFDSGTSNDTKRAVRVQAAKASAAARKATIAKKLAQQKRNVVGTEPAEASGPPKETLGQWDSRPASAKRKRTFTPASAQAGPSNDALRGNTALRGKGVARAPAPARTQRVDEVEDDQIKQAFAGAIIQRPQLPTSASSTDLASVGASHHHVVSEDDRPLTPPIPCNCFQCMPHLARYKRDSTEFSFSGVDYGNANAWLAGASGELPSTPLSLRSLSQIHTESADPFNCCPVPFFPIFDQLLHHMLTVFAPRGWPALKISRREGLNWEWFMQQHALAEPALFYVRLLFASGDLVRLKVMKPEISWWLQSLAVNMINEALRDPERATSDGLILAVGRISLHETLYGDLEAASTMHRPAQRLMIDMRGGMKALDYPLLVKRLMRWADRVMSMRSGTPRLLPDNEDLGNSTFSLEETLEVTHKWHPTLGQALRRKIAISDIVD